MVDIKLSRGMCLVIIRRIYNQPGIGKIVMEKLKNNGIEIKEFQAIAAPRSVRADVLGFVVPEDKAEEAIKSITQADGKVGGELPVIIKGVLGIGINGFTESATEAFYNAFTVCEKLGINVIYAAHSVSGNLSFYIEEKSFNDTLVENLKRAFSAEGGE